MCLLDVEPMNKDYYMGIETPMYEWYQYSPYDGPWHFDFLDHDVEGWQITVEHLSDTPPDMYYIVFLSWSRGDLFQLTPVYYDSFEKAKQYALDKARELFQDFDFPNNQ